MCRVQPDIRRTPHRAHPARHARRVTGTVAAGGAIALFGWFGITNDATATTSSTRTVVPAVTGGAGVSSTQTSPSVPRRTQNLPARPRPAQSTSRPSTHSGGS